jgi:hypothetical protein
MRLRAAIITAVICLGLIAIASTAFDHQRAESQRCWASPLPGGGFVLIGC